MKILHWSQQSRFISYIVILETLLACCTYIGGKSGICCNKMFIIFLHKFQYRSIHFKKLNFLWAKLYFPATGHTYFLLSSWLHLSLELTNISQWLIEYTFNVQTKQRKTTTYWARLVKTISCTITVHEERKLMLKMSTTIT